jgi:putative ABC transport system substrate-binding protein
MTVKRREFVLLLGGAAVWPLAVQAQQGERMRRIGVLMALAANDPEGQRRAATFEAGLRELGWAEGRNLRTDYRWAPDDPDRLRSAAAELVAMSPDLILATSTPVLAALRQVNTTLPIVFVQVTDPVEQGFVENLARPGGNITGFASWEFSIGGKWLEMLREMAPAVTRVAIVFNPHAAPYAPAFLGPIEAAAPSFAVKSMAVPASDAASIEAAIEAFARKANGGLIVLPDVTMLNHRDLIIALAARYRLPAIYPFPFFATNGGLISYGPDAADAFRRAATYVDRILKGAKPADLPVQAPTKYELVINLKTVKALGLTVPLIMQMTADEVIE